MKTDSSLSAGRRAPTALDSAHFRQVMGRYPTGISMITAKDPSGEPVGMIVGTFGSVSLEPPLVSFMPTRISSTWPQIRESSAFCVNVLSVEQEAVCRAFRAQGAERFAGEPMREGATGSPILERSVAWIDCEIESVLEAGDHFIVLGRVVAMDSPNTDLPLLFFQGGYGSFNPQTMVTPELDVVGNLAFVDRARSHMESLAASVRCECVLATSDSESVLIMASAGMRADSQLATIVGERVPLAAPFGRTAMAWAQPSEVEGWLASSDAGDRQVSLEMLATIRRRGYSLTVNGDGAARRPGSHAVSILDSGAELGLAETPIGGEVHSISAPVMNSRGTVEFVLGLYGMADTGAEELERSAKALTDTIAHLEKSLNDR